MGVEGLGGGVCVLTVGEVEVAEGWAEGAGADGA